MLENIRLSFKGIWSHKMRSFLTMLGIIIGIASVIAIVSIGEGTKNQMNSEIDGIGGGQIYISISNDAMTEGDNVCSQECRRNCSRGYKPRLPCGCCRSGS